MSSSCRGCRVIGHKLAEKLGAAQHRKPLTLCLLVFFVVFADRCRVYYDVDPGYNIRSFLPAEHGGAQILQMMCQGGLFVVGSGDAESFLQQDLGKTAHADAANADKVYVYRLLKINFIHKIPSS